MCKKCFQKVFRFLPVIYLLHFYQNLVDDSKQRIGVFYSVYWGKFIPSHLAISNLKRKVNGQYHNDYLCASHKIGFSSITTYSGQGLCFIFCFSWSHYELFDCCQTFKIFSFLGCMQVWAWIGGYSTISGFFL